ncbi:MAG: pyridoxal 5'-phosphate synthase glutaminase subunit PdxT [Bryobacteraceae bacterium]
MNLGVLALQGDFEAHVRAFEEAGRDGGLEVREVRTAADLDGVDALVIPGGESTTMLKLIGMENLTEPLLEFGQRKPIFGTCAGAILLAKEVASPAQWSLGLMDIAVERNAYGRQVHSDVTRVDLLPGGPSIEAVFIRAPIIRRAGPGVRVLAVRDGNPILAAEGLHMAATFHPELTADRTVQRLFLEHARRSMQSGARAGAAQAGAKACGAA